MEFFAKKRKKGFTLIELLVVIAIIGILAAIVLVSMAGVRNRAKDTRVVSSMDQFRTQATLLYDIHNSYSNATCTSITDTACTCADTSIDALCEDIVLNDYQTAGDNLVIRLDANGHGFCTYAHLLGSDQYWCVDGDLHSKAYVAAPAACAVGCVVANTCACE